MICKMKCDEDDDEDDADDCDDEWAKGGGAQVKAKEAIESA